MTPYEIDILMNIYVSPSKLLESPNLEDTINKFLAEELINVLNSYESGYIISRRGNEYIRRLMALPLPLYEGEEIT